MQELTGNKIDIQPKLSRNGKRLWSKAQKRLIVSEAMSSGMSVSKVSRRYDINANLIFRWMKAAGNEIEEKQQLIPLGIIATSREMVSTQTSSPLLPSAPPVPSGTSKMIEVELRGGTRIRIDGGVKDATLAQVLKLVRSLA